jgi:hypothetical protein
MNLIDMMDLIRLITETIITPNTLREISLLLTNDKVIETDMKNLEAEDMMIGLVLEIIVTTETDMMTTEEILVISTEITTTIEESEAEVISNKEAHRQSLWLMNLEETFPSPKDRKVLNVADSPSCSCVLKKKNVIITCSNQVLAKAKQHRGNAKNE